MKEKDFDIKTKVIKETFDDNSHIVSSIDPNELEIDSNIHQGGDIFITSTGEFIDLEFQDVDFTAEELAKYYTKNTVKEFQYIFSAPKTSALMSENLIFIQMPRSPLNWPASMKIRVKSS